MNKKIVYISLFIVLLLVLSITLAYAYFSLVVENDTRENIVETGTLSIHYKDGPEIIMNNMYPGESITKTFTVENTGSLEAEYSIYWKNLLNEIEKDELVYTLSLNNVDIKGVVPLTDEELKKGIYIKPKEIHEYTLIIMFIETNSSQNYNQGKRFSTKINITGENVSENTVNVVSLYVDEKHVSKLDDDKIYVMNNYVCSNGETVEWDPIKNKISILPIFERTNCEVYFEEVNEKTEEIEELYIKDSMTLWYDGIYNSGIGTERSTTTTTWTNLAGTTLNGNIYNGSSLGATWGSNYLSFDGNDHVKIAAMNYSEVTMEIILKKTSNTTAQEMILGNTETGGYDIILKSGNIISEYYGSGRYRALTYNNLNQNDMYYISYSIKPLLQNLFINGNVVATDTLTYNIKTTEGGTIMMIGASPSGSSSGLDTFTGEIYAVRIYNRALTEEEILHNYKIDKARYNLN